MVKEDLKVSLRIQYLEVSNLQKWSASDHQSQTPVPHSFLIGNQIKILKICSWNDRQYTKLATPFPFTFIYIFHRSLHSFLLFRKSISLYISFCNWCKEGIYRGDKPIVCWLFFGHWQHLHWRLFTLWLVWLFSI